ncbi:MAG: adenine methylase [Pseudomonadota bacterium]|jgi:DNA adenine methylase
MPAPSLRALPRPSAQQLAHPGLLPAQPPAQARPFVKWAGGKRRLIDELLEGAPAGFRRYHEPFVGGGALFFALAGRYVRPGAWASLSDVNIRLVRTWRAVQNDVEGLILRLKDYAEAHDEEQFYAVRAIDVDKFDDDTDVAAWFIYLNKTAYNGLYRVNRSGGFNVPLGRYADPQICDPDGLRLASRALAGAHIEHAAFDSVLDRALPGDFVYFDPPYVPVSHTADFTSYTADGFSMADQARLRDVAAALKDRGVHVLLSNSDTATVRELYQGSFHHRTVLCGRAINSRASSRGRVAELLIS